MTSDAELLELVRSRYAAAALTVSLEGRAGARLWLRCR